MATELPLEGATIDPGTPVTMTMVFENEPPEVYASFTRPQEERAVVDPGHGKPGSRIRRVSETSPIYSYKIDTTGFKEGKLEFHMWGVDEASKYGFVMIKKRKPQLL